MTRYTNRDRTLVSGLIVVLAIAVILVWVVANTQPTGRPTSARVAEAASGRALTDGQCFAQGDVLIPEPDPAELSRLVRDKGKDARLKVGWQAAPNAEALATRTGGEVVTTEEGETHILYTGNDRRVETFTRFESSDGDRVWTLTGTTRQVDCGFELPE